MKQVRGIGRGRVGALAMGLVTTVGALAALPAPPVAAAGEVTPTTRRVQLTQPADSFLGTFTPDATATSEGTYGPQVRWPVIPLQAVLEPNGKVVTYGSPVGVAAQRGLAYDEWDPAYGTSSAAHAQTASMHDYDSFCSGMQLLSDGRILMVGGNSSMSSMIFDPKRQQQTAGPALADQRWYATTLKRPDGKILVLGGGNYYNTLAFKNPKVTKGVAMTPELGTGTSAWTALTGATSATAFGPTDNRWWYPRAYNAPNGKVVGFSADQLWTLDTNGKGSLKSLGKLPMSIGISGSSVMYAPGKILIAGGGQQTNADKIKATNAAAVIDISGATPKATTVASMKHGRNWLNLTVLANGEVLANGGTAVGVTGPVSNSVRQSEIFNPTTKTWRTGATAQRTRTYHSISLLMPSGAVLTGGGGIPGPEDNMNAELYYPSYLFDKGSDGVVRWADRAQIDSLGGRIGYGSTLSLGMSDDRPIASAALTSLGVVTHSFNVDQRRVPVTITRQAGSEVRVALPTDQNTLPPGSYMLTVTDDKGVPSPAQIITIRANGSGQVTIYDKTEARGGGQSGDTTTTGIVDPTPGTGIGLEPYAQWGYRVQNADGTAVTSAVGSGDELSARQSTSFVVRRGLGDANAVSFEEVSRPGHYLAVSPGAPTTAWTPVVFAKNDGSAGFAARATFTPVNGLMGQFTSFRQTSNPNRYLRQVGSNIKLLDHDGSDTEREQTTFAVRKSLAPVPDEMAGPTSCCDPGGTNGCC